MIEAADALDAPHTAPPADGMNEIVALDVAGLHVPGAGPVFLSALAVHVAAGVTAVVAGVLATTARKRPGRHPGAGIVYLYAITVVFVTATAMAILRWRHDWHLFLIATVASGLAALGWWARRRRPRRWMLWHGAGMAGSYTALLTGFYVDNGPQLPLWDRLPHLTYWLLPAAIGVPLTWRALIRNGAIDGDNPTDPVAPPTAAGDIAKSDCPSRADSNWTWLGRHRSG